MKIQMLQVIQASQRTLHQGPRLLLLIPAVPTVKVYPLVTQCLVLLTSQLTVQIYLLLIYMKWIHRRNLFNFLR